MRAEATLALDGCIDGARRTIRPRENGSVTTEEYQMATDDPWHTGPPDLVERVARAADRGRATSPKRP